MHCRRFAFAALVLAVLLAPLLVIPAALATEDMVWSFTELNDPDNKGRLTARLSYGVPETDNIQVSGVCDGAPSTGTAFSSLTFGAGIGDLQDGAETELRFSGGGFDHAVKGTISRPHAEEGISGVHLDLPHDDPLWQALQEKDGIDYFVPGYRASTLDLTRGKDKIKSFIDACRAYAKAVLGDQEAGAVAAGEAAPEKEAFEAAKELGTKDAWDAFLASYPTGFHADLARAYLKKLAGGGGSAPSAAPKAAAPVSLPTQKAASVSCKKLGSIRSKYSNRPTKITFVNNSGAYRGILWIDFKGHPKDYANLQAGQQITFDTFQSHPWMVTDGPGNCLEIALPRSVPSLVTIEKARAQLQAKRPAWQIEAIKKGCKPGLAWNPQEGCHEND